MSPSYHHGIVAEIDPVTLYRILWLRVGAFVVEQETLRILRDSENLRIGRVATAPALRGKGVAAELIRRAIVRCGEINPSAAAPQKRKSPVMLRICQSSAGVPGLEPRTRDLVEHTAYPVMHLKPRIIMRNLTRRVYREPVLSRGDPGLSTAIRDRKRDPSDPSECCSGDSARHGPTPMQRRPGTVAAKRRWGSWDQDSGVGNRNPI